MKRRASIAWKAGRSRKRMRTGFFVQPAMVNKRIGYNTVARTRGVYARGEMKYFDSVRDNVSVTASATWANTVYDPNVFPVAGMNTLFAPTVGAGINQRIGKACKVHKIKITGCFSIPPQINQVAADAGSYIRLMLVEDKQTNGTQMTGGQVMTAPGVASAILAVESFQNIDNFGRFKVLKDKTFVIQNPSIAFDGTNVEQSGLIRKFKMTYKPRKPVEVRFNATNGGTIADIVDHSWHIIANNSSADLNPNISYYCRVCFKE